MKSLLLSVVALCSATAALALDPPATLPSWLAGAWEMHEGESWSDEYWTAPRAGLMIGAARMGKGDTLQMWENTRIERKADGSISFFAQPRGVPAAEFPLVAHGDGMIEFANPAHDYPQRIRYWREGRLLKARISLIDGSKPMEWSYAPLGGD
ncbi:DUF6265 family protein [Novosphingobium arvoryzae]|uniref:DUF6265 family protein n=1 Tax=Novosphingobium arvoryzae TaxID=1256514 RepID=UPI0035B2622B